MALVLASGVLAGCGRSDVQVYKVAKEPAQASPAAMPPGHPDASAAASAPALKYKAPQGWQEVAPGEMRAASFRIAGQNGKQADVSVIPLPGLAGGDLDNVNRWRGQVGLAAVSQEEMTKMAQAVEIDHQPAQLYDQAGEKGADKAHILGAITRRDGVAWFFKMTGDDALVAQQKPAFIEFLQSVAFPANDPQAALPPSHPPIAGASELPPSHPPIGGGTEMPPAHPAIGASGMGAQTPATASSGQDKPNWQVPSGWQETPGGQFLVAKFLVKGAGDAQAAVNVSMSVGDGGGLLANLNRWRGQLGLTPVAEADLASQVQPLIVTLPDSKAMLAEMAGTDARTGQKTRLLAAVVPQGQQTWFYKLMGNEQVVEQQKEAFTKFVQAVKYP